VYARGVPERRRRGLTATTRAAVARTALAAFLSVLAAACGDSSSSPPTELAGVRFANVGRVAATFVDASRPTQANGSYPGAPARTLPSLVWYPSSAGGAEEGASEVPCLGGGAERCTVVPDAALDGAGAPYPLIVFSHGFGNGATATTSYAQALAQHGYVVVAPDFPLSNRNAPGGASVNDLPAQAGDVGFLIDVFLGAVASVPSPFPGAIDAQAVGAAGRSLGGSTTLLATHSTSYLDPRIRASAPISPGWFVQTALLPNVDYFTGITTPLLIIGGSDDTTTPFAENQQAPYDLAGAPKALVELFGQEHTPQTVEANTALVAFFDAYLLGRTDELTILDALPNARVERVR